jgi:hypothetical protein
MSDSRRQKLLKLDKEILANSLLNLADNGELAAEDVVKKLIRDPGEHLKFFKQKINGLKRRTSFIFYRETPSFAKKLSNLLEDIATSDLKPEDGLKLMASFFETDSFTVGIADDSSGYIGDVYNNDATELLHKFASGCKNKRAALEVIIKIYDDNGYGVRDHVLDEITQSLGEEEARYATNIFSIRAEEADNDYDKWRNGNAIGTIAKSLGDAPLYEKSELMIHKELSPNSYLDIARVYLENDDPWTALNRIKNISSDNMFVMQDQRNLLQQIYNKMGNKDKEAEIAREKFNSSPSVDTLDNLIRIIGEDKRESVIEDKVVDFIDGGEVDYSDIQFLLNVNRIEEAEICILSKHAAGTLNGAFYFILLPFAEKFEEVGRKLAASLIYRNLLNSLLERSYNKGYSIAATYLRKLDLLALEIEDWVGFREHGLYHVWLNQEHGKKSSFWAKYREGK